MLTKIHLPKPSDFPPSSRFRRAIDGRDARFDGRFVFGVTTTGIYCRPSCPARRPRPENLVLFDTPRAAEDAGYRACKRCRPGDVGAIADPLAVVIRAARYIEGHAGDAVPLADVARAAGRSPHHLQRVFTRHVGVSPRQYAHARRVARIQERLRAGVPVTDALYEAGFGSSSRVYEQSAAILGMRPARFRGGGAGERIHFAIVPTALGSLLVAATAAGIFRIALGEGRRTLIAQLRADFPNAQIAPGDRALATVAQRVSVATKGGRAAPRAADGHSRDRVPTTCLERAAPDLARVDADLRADRARDRSAEGGARRRACLRRESRRAHRALSPRRSGRWDGRWVSMGRGSESALVGGGTSGVRRRIRGDAPRQRPLDLRPIQLEAARQVESHLLQVHFDDRHAPVGERLH